MELFKKLGRIANVNTACLNHLGVGILTLGDFFYEKTKLSLYSFVCWFCFYVRLATLARGV